MNNMERVQVILTCYNRKQFTLRCIESLQNSNPNIEFHFVVVDDNSTDGTFEALCGLPYSVEVIKGTGQLYWNGGMYLGLSTVIDRQQAFDYALLVNDDVDFYPGCIEKAIAQSKKENNAVIVGETVDSEGKTSYGGIAFLSHVRVKYTVLEPSDALNCDTFNANCVLVPCNVLKEVGNLDSYYKHAMGDFDYGMMIKRKGFEIHHTPFYVGECNENVIEGTWLDASLSRMARFRLKESNKGLPIKDWFHFVNKNFSFGAAVYHMLTPYIRILFRK